MSRDHYIGIEAVPNSFGAPEEVYSVDRLELFGRFVYAFTDPDDLRALIHPAYNEEFVFNDGTMDNVQNNSDELPRIDRCLEGRGRRDFEHFRFRIVKPVLDPDGLRPVQASFVPVSLPITGIIRARLVWCNTSIDIAD